MIRWETIFSIPVDNSTKNTVMRWEPDGDKVGENTVIRWELDGDKAGDHLIYLSCSFPLINPVGCARAREGGPSSTRFLPFDWQNALGLFWLSGVTFLQYPAEQKGRTSKNVDAPAARL